MKTGDKIIDRFGEQTITFWQQLLKNDLNGSLREKERFRREEDQELERSEI